MSREPHIPLFLWIATAIVAHAIWGGGAHQASKALEETLDIGAFAREVQRHVRLHSVPVEVSILEEQEVPTEESPSESDTSDVTDEATPDETTEEVLEREKEKEEEKRKEEEKERERPEKEKPEEQVPEEEPKKDQPDVVIPPEALNRIAVEQHVEDKEQEDNPDAAHIAEHANRVEEETRARITSTDRNEAEPSPGGHHVGSDPDPGNSEESRIAQSDDAAGDTERPPGDTSGEQPRPPVAAEPPPRAANARAPGAGAPRAPASPPSAAQEHQDESPHVHDHASGRWSLARPLEGQNRQKALPPRVPQKPTDLLGLGAAGTTRNGVNLNLSPQMAVAAVGADQLARERRLDGQRRKSAHRGSWKSMGLERWKPALENYVASVKPGNQTALNTARVPFARYLNAIHLRLHPIFADRFLSTLESLPKDHPLNRDDMSTHLEIVLSKEDGRIVRMGITKSSGVTAFDVGALDSVQKASPFGAPPDVIVSPDGNVYLHWEFHRLPHYACSTYFARPYLLKSAPGTAPPRQGPPPMPPPRGERPYDPSRAAPVTPGERSGFLDRDRREAAQPRG